MFTIRIRIKEWLYYRAANITATIPLAPFPLGVNRIKWAVANSIYRIANAIA